MIAIHFILDLQSLPNSISILRIIDHYINKYGGLQYTVLELKEIDGKHTGENQAIYFLEVINDYEIKSKIGYLMMDNIASNDILVKTVSDKLSQEGIIYDPYIHYL